MKHLKKLEVHVDEDSDADLPAAPPKRKAAGLASGSTTKGTHSPPRERTWTRTLSPFPPPSYFNSDGTRCALMPSLLPVARANVIPEKNNMKTKEKNEEKKRKAKERATSAERGGENKGEEGRVEEGGESQSCCPETRSRFPLTRIYL